MKYWEEVANLGERIIKALEIKAHDDPLRCWMAHYIAELMDSEKSAKSEKQRTAIRKNCTELILRLWKIRYRFDPSHPLSQLSRKLEILAGDKPWSRPFVETTEGKAQTKEKHSGPKYEKNLKLIAELAEEDKRVVFIALTADLPRKAPEEFQDGENADEADVAFNYRNLITTRDRLAKGANTQSLKDIVDAKTKAARKSAIARALMKTNERRQKLIKMLS